MLSQRLLAISPLVAIAFAACAPDATAPRLSAADAALDPSRVRGARAATHAQATLIDVRGVEIGRARFTQDGTGRVHVNVQVRGISPGLHGLHLHAVGVCALGTTPAFTSAGGHYNPHGRQHGHHNPNGAHAGDLPNLVVNAAGNGHLNVALEQFSLAELADANGTAIVVHQNEDDLMTDPTGNSGARIACGVVAAR